MSAAGPDIGVGQSLGQRKRQEDRVAVWPDGGAEPALLVLSDGMGGAVGGDVAAELIVETVVGAFAEAAGGPGGPPPAPGVLRAAAERANQALRRRTAAEPDLRGMGGTLVAVHLLPGGVMFFSMGDSPLYLVRGGRAHRMNADHSVGGALDAAAARGEISPEDALARRDRNSIMSVLTGEPIAAMRMDETADVVPLTKGDLLVLASDGLDTLSPEEIAEIAGRPASSADLVAALLAAVEAAARPRQDNTTVVVARI